MKLLSKFLTTSSLLSGAFLIDFDDSETSKPFQKNEAKITKIDSVNDIKLFEKQNNCKFAFVDSWENRKILMVDGFLKNYKEKIWESYVIGGAERFKNYCKNKTINLFFKNNERRFWLNDTVLP